MHCVRTSIDISTCLYSISMSAFNHSTVICYQGCLYDHSANHTPHENTNMLLQKTGGLLWSAQFMHLSVWTTGTIQPLFCRPVFGVLIGHVSRHVFRECLKGVHYCHDMFNQYQFQTALTWSSNLSSSSPVCTQWLRAPDSVVSYCYSQIFTSSMYETIICYL